MTLRYRSGSGWAVPSFIRRRENGGWVNVQTVRRRENGGWVTVWTAMAVSYSPTYATGYASARPASGRPTSNDVTAYVTSNSGSVSYSWERISGDTNIIAKNPSAAQTAFTVTNPIGYEVNAVFRCKATDSAGNATYGPDLAVQLVYTSTFTD